MRGLHRVAAACMAAGVVLVLHAEQGPAAARGGGAGAAAARAMARLGRRVTGDEMPTDATMSPCKSRIGAATHRTSSMYSPSSSANPLARTCAHTVARRITDFTVVRV